MDRAVPRSGFFRVIPALVGLFGGPLSADEGGGDGAYEGELLRVMTFHDPQSVALFELVREFERRTGAFVEMTQIRHPEMARPTILRETLPRFDLVTVDEPHLAHLAGLLEPFDEWPRARVFGTPSPEAPGHSLAVRMSTVGGRLMGLPVNPNVYLFAYRKDLWEDPGERRRFRERYGRDLRPPANAGEYAELSEFFHRPPDLYGFAPVREASEAGTIELIWLLALFGERLFGDGLRIAFDPEVAGEALEWYGELLAWAPAGRDDWHYEARADLLRTGRLAHGMNWPAYLPDAMDPADSRVTGDLGFACGPAGPDGEPVNITGFWTIAIPAESTAKRLAAEFAAFWTSRRTNVRLLRRGGAPSREDVLREPRLRGAVPWSEAYFEALRHPLARPSDPGYPAVSAKVAAIFDRFVEGEAGAEETVAALLALDRAKKEDARR